MTRKTRSFRLSPATIISCVALFLALTGSAFAVGVAKNSVRSAQIANGTIRTVDLRKNAIKAAKIAPDQVRSEEIAPGAVGSPEVLDDSLTALDLGPGSVTSSELADKSVTAGDLAADSVGASQLQANSVHSSELGTVAVRNNSQAIVAGATGSVAVSCLAGEQVLSGGGQSGHYGVEVTSTRPAGNGWLFQAKNNTGTNSTLTVYAVCLTA